MNLFAIIPALFLTKKKKRLNHSSFLQDRNIKSTTIIRVVSKTTYQSAIYCTLFNTLLLTFFTILLWNAFIFYF